MMNVPRIRLSDIPEKYCIDARHLQKNLYTLDRTVKELEHTISLSLTGYNQAGIERQKISQLDSGSEVRQFYSDRSEMFLNWGSIGGRHGALIIHGFLRTKQITDVLVKSIPYILERVDRSSQKMSNSLFEKSFPKISLLRHNVAHPGEFGSTKESYAKESISGPVAKGKFISVDNESSLLIDGTMLGSEYCSTIDGQIVCYEVSQNSVDNLRKIADLYFDAFRPLAPIY
jgi:hypothetical protein